MTYLDWLKNSDARAFAWFILGVAGLDIEDEKNNEKVEEIMKLLEKEIEFGEE